MCEICWSTATLIRGNNYAVNLILNVILEFYDSDCSIYRNHSVTMNILRINSNQWFHPQRIFHTGSNTGGMVRWLKKWSNETCLTWSHIHEKSRWLNLKMAQNLDHVSFYWDGSLFWAISVFMIEKEYPPYTK